MNARRGGSRFDPLVVVAGARTPFAKAFSALADYPAQELGRLAVAGALQHCGLQPTDVDETVFGNVAGVPEAANIARVISLSAGIPWDRPAHTVNRNCGSGMEAVLSAWQIIRDGRARLVVAGGTESMSNVPFLWDKRMKDWLVAFGRAPVWKKAALLAKLRPRYFRPIPALQLGLTDPSCGLNMGQTAEVLAKEFAVSRDKQDAFALQSHLRAAAAWKRCFYKGEVAPVEAHRAGGTPLLQDSGVRPHQTLEALSRLPPLFDRNGGTVTAGNSCPISDGAAAMIVTTVERANSMGFERLGYVRDYAVVGCDPSRMGLGPVFAIHKLLKTTGMALSDFELFEINEAFAAQVLACRKAMNSADFARQSLGEMHALGEFDPELTNVNGGAIALGHPVGASGARLILTLLRALREQRKRRGLAALCVGGGQGIAVWVETELTE